MDLRLLAAALATVAFVVGLVATSLVLQVISAVVGVLIVVLWLMPYYPGTSGGIAFGVGQIFGFLLLAFLWLGHLIAWLAA